MVMYTARQKNLLKAYLFQDIEGDIVQLVSDIVYNILYGDNIKVTPKKKQLLLKHKQSLENLSKKVTPFKKKTKNYITKRRISITLVGSTSNIIN